MPITTTAEAYKVFNPDIANLSTRLERFKMEMVKSVSANVSELNEFDLARLREYLKAAHYFIGWMTSQPLLDLPETSPVEVTVRAMIPVDNLDNDDLYLIVKLIETAQLELIKSQSARRSSGLMIHDLTRLNSYLAKIENFLDGYVSMVNPLDLPESSPATPMQGHGN